VGISAAKAEADLRKSHAAFVSTGAVGKSIIVRDPDGHAVEIAQP